MAERKNWIEQARATFRLVRLLNKMAYPIWYSVFDIPKFPRQASEVLRYRERLADRTYTNVLSMHRAMWENKSDVNPYLKLLPSGVLKFISRFESFQKVDF